MTSAIAPPELDLALELDASLSPGLCIAAGALCDPGLAESRWHAHLSRWLGALAAELPDRLRAPAYSLGLQLTGDAVIAALNATWRHREGATDVLAFAAQEEAPPLPVSAAGQGPEVHGQPLELGDLVISLETAARQAEGAGHDLERELLFLASHGLLHLLGWDHPDEPSLAAMLERQERLLDTP